ncbi:helix-turn-helix domain-containing protein [Candidatus Tokpelaia sp.]|uniref:helix-turn-helix domain-containing protein n=1 Tax=Candidatus Tokpelaia sp. TaxID=2233777 RepID=UPI00123A7B38|nr:helix-turn-helix transcriptional regulator [Candidatus Tokpelaia sp.]KAA6405058.1 transcriptional regulator [Candidatus Tokpelaia sp.]
MARAEKKPETELAERLRSVRRHYGDPKREYFAKKIGISANSLAAYERGENEPAASTLSAYIELCGINPSWLLTGNGSMFQEKKPDLDLERLAKVLELIENELDAAGKYLIPKDKAELIKRIYDSHHRDEDKEKIIHLIHAA